MIRWGANLPGPVLGDRWPIVAARDGSTVLVVALCVGLVDQYPWLLAVTAGLIITAWIAGSVLHRGPRRSALREPPCWLRLGGRFHVWQCLQVLEEFVRAASVWLGRA